MCGWLQPEQAQRGFTPSQVSGTTRRSWARVFFSFGWAWEILNALNLFTLWWSKGHTSAKVIQGKRTSDSYLLFAAVWQVSEMEFPEMLTIFFKFTIFQVAVPKSHLEAKQKFSFKLCQLTRSSFFYWGWFLLNNL